MKKTTKKLSTKKTSAKIKMLHPVKQMQVKAPSMEKKNTASKETPRKKTPKTTGKATTKAAEALKATAGQSVDLKKELISELIERGKRTNMLTYEEIIEFGDKNHLSEQETNDLLQQLEKENIDLVMQEELETKHDNLLAFESDESSARPVIKAKLSEPIVSETEDFEEQEEQEEEEERVTRESAPAHLTDAVKCYLRDIGKIPLFNKKTEKVIADMIAEGKRESIDALSRYPFIHKEFIAIKRKATKK